MCNKDLSNNLSRALCGLDKIETLTKLLSQTITEKSDFQAKDSLNICSLLIFCVNDTKRILTNLENSTTEKTL